LPGLQSALPSTKPTAVRIAPPPQTPLPGLPTLPTMLRATVPPGLQPPPFPFSLHLTSNDWNFMYCLLPGAFTPIPHVLRTTVAGQVHHATETALSSSPVPPGSSTSAFTSVLGPSKIRPLNIPMLVGGPRSYRAPRASAMVEVSLFRLQLAINISRPVATPTVCIRQNQ
jgi:hypothetical protein